MATIFFFPVFRESLRAASFASAPELQKKTLELLSPVNLTNSEARLSPFG